MLTHLCPGKIYWADFYTETIFSVRWTFKYSHYHKVNWEQKAALKSFTMHAANGMLTSLNQIESIHDLS